MAVLGMHAMMQSSRGSSSTRPPAPRDPAILVRERRGMTLSREAGTVHGCVQGPGATTLLLLVHMHGDGAIVIRPRLVRKFFKKIVW
jgi:hypothetical protein